MEDWRKVSGRCSRGTAIRGARGRGGQRTADARPGVATQLARRRVVGVWMAVNPVVFGKPAHERAWATRAVLGEEQWIAGGRWTPRWRRCRRDRRGACRDGRARSAARFRPRRPRWWRWGCCGVLGADGSVRRPQRWCGLKVLLMWLDSAPSVPPRPSPHERTVKSVATGQGDPTGNGSGDEQAETRGSEYDGADHEDLRRLIDVDEQHPADRQERSANEGVQKRNGANHGVRLIRHAASMPVGGDPHQQSSRFISMTGQRHERSRHVDW